MIYYNFLKFWKLYLLFHLLFDWLCDKDKHIKLFQV